MPRRSLLEVDKPTKLPRWADEADPGHITEPSDVQKGTGWATVFVVWQYFNWLLYTIYQWLAWSDQTTHRTDDAWGDQALPDGDTPSTGAGLTISAADFSARVYAAGYEVPLTSYPAAGDTYTYSASSDTYWDLKRDTTWTPVAVVNDDPEPAVTANSVRVFKVVTNATNRTSVEDRRRAHPTMRKAVDVTGQRRYAIEDAISKVGDAEVLNADVIEPKRIDLVHTQGGWTYECVDGVEDSNDSDPRWRTYVRMIGGTKYGTVRVWGAKLTTASGTVQWTNESTTVVRLEFDPGGKGVRYVKRTGQTVSATVNDSVFYDESSSVVQQLPIDSGLILGAGLIPDVLDGVSRTPHIKHARADFMSYARTLLRSDGTWFEYLALDDLVTFTGTFAHEEAYNAVYNEGLGQWERVLGGYPSMLFVQNDQGVRQVFRRASGDASPWDSADWASIEKISVNGLSIDTGSITSAGDVTAAAIVQGAKLHPTDVVTGGTTPDKNTAYANTTVKAEGAVYIAPGGGISTQYNFGCNVTITSNELVVTYHRAMDIASHRINHSLTWVNDPGAPGNVGYVSVVYTHSQNGFIIRVVDLLASGNKINLSSAGGFLLNFSVSGVLT